MECDLLRASCEHPNDKSFELIFGVFISAIIVCTKKTLKVVKVFCYIGYSHLYLQRWLNGMSNSGKCSPSFFSQMFY